MSARGDARPAWLLFLLLSALYLFTRCESFGPGDSAQHALSALVWGVSRPPGYPLYTALGHLFVRLLPVAPPSAAGALSALCQAGAAALLFAAARRGGCSRPAALSGALLLALAPLWWYYAGVAEVRGLNDLLAAAAAWAAAAGLDAAVVGALLGLGLSHHPTFVFVVPSILLLRRERGGWARLSAAAAAGLLAPYALLWARLALGAAPRYDPDGVAARGLSGVLGLLLRRDTGGLLSVSAGASSGAPTGIARQLGWFAASAWTSLSAGLLLAPAGAWALRARRREAAALLLWALLPAAAYAVLAGASLRGLDPEYARAVANRFHLLPLCGLALLAAHGAELLAARVRPAYAWALAAAAIAGACVRPVDLRRHHPTRDYAEAVLAQTGPGDAVALASDDSVFALLYADLGEGRGGGRVWLMPWLSNMRAPGLAAPADPRDWDGWLRLNPGRTFWAEATLRGPVTAALPDSYPDGALIRLARAPARPDAAAAARRWLDNPLSRASRWNVEDFTQEVVLWRLAGAQGGFHLDRLRGRPPELVEAVSARLYALP